MRPGSNRPPPTCFNHPLDHPAVKVQVAAMDRLKQAAVYEAEGDVQRFIKANWGDVAACTRAAPSRLAKCPRDRKILKGVFDVAYGGAIRTRLAQLNRIDEKLVRLCPDWPRHTADELCEVPQRFSGPGDAP